MIVRVLLLIWILGWCGWLVGQENDGSLSPTAEAIEAYNKGDYLAAINHFKQLLFRYPKDPLYHYYLGSSLVVSNVDLLQGIELLKYAVSRSDINEANYFLGMAYYRLYDFNRAMEYYQAFKEGASLGQLKEFSVHRQMQRINYVKPLLTVVTVPVVIDKKTVGDSAALCEEAKRWTGFCFPEKPLSLEVQNVPGEYFYYTAMSPYKVRKKDLYRVKKLPGGWGTPENLGSTVNSAEDDINPFYIAEDQTLYFASKGNEGHGGYDIFKTHYDSVKKTWSKPENLPFPLNSPYDEIAYFFDKTSGFALLISNRENDYKTYTFYYLDAKAIHHIREIKASADLLQESRLEINASEEMRIRFQRYRNKMGNKEPERKEIIVSRDSRNVSSDKMTEEYVSLVSDALQYQVKSDSLSFVADRLRGFTTVIADPVERGKVQKEIIQMETQAKTLQEKADKLYLEVREKELEQDAHNRSLYKKTETSSGKDTVSEALSKEYAFEILPSSPYSEKNPIPMDVPCPSGVLYKIQLGVFSKSVPPTQFNGLKPVTGERLNEGSVIKYYAGWFTSYEEAEQALRKVQEYGYKQAFIVAYYNGEKLPVNRARQLEKE